MLQEPPGNRSWKEMKSLKSPVPETFPFTTSVPLGSSVDDGKSFPKSALSLIVDACAAPLRAAVPAAAAMDANMSLERGVSHMDLLFSVRSPASKW
jgi:hypothetical protein